jgi:hypothetical protein
MKLTQESFEQPLLFGPSANELALHCYHNSGTNLPSTVLCQTLTLNPTVSRKQAQHFLLLKGNEEQCLLV